jgi:hypothetical protein
VGRGEGQTELEEEIEKGGVSHRQIYCIILFTNAACLFGSLISQLNDILQVKERKE